ncbi:hypothetical protein F5887DRAFT_903094, partial [Amanita rubescens]
LPKSKKITISYISRQPSMGRRLTPDSHEGLVRVLQELVDRRNSARTGEVGEEPDKDEQIQFAAIKTFLVGVHGNLFMPSTRVSTSIEIFYPQGYQWTSTALGMKRYGIWNDT